MMKRDESKVYINGSFAINQVLCHFRSQIFYHSILRKPLEELECYYFRQKFFKLLLDLFLDLFFYLLSILGNHIFSGLLLQNSLFFLFD